MPPAAATSAQALQNLQSFQGSAQNPEQMLQAQEGQLGVQAQQQQVSGLRQAIANTTNLLNQVAPSVYGRTGGSLVTDAQASRQIGNEQAPLNTTLGKQNQDYNLQNADLNTSQQRAESLANLKYQGQQGQLSYLQSMYHDLQASEQAARDEAYRQQQAAESKRQFNATLAEQQAARKAAAAGSGTGLSTLLGNIGNAGGNNSTGKQSAPPSLSSLANKWSAKDWLGYIQQTAQNNGGLGNWASMAHYIETQLGHKIGSGSTADIGLQYAFGNRLINEPRF